MGVLVWIVVSLVMLIIFVVGVVAVRPGSAKPIAMVLRSLEGPLRVVVPWSRRNPTADSDNREKP